MTEGKLINVLVHSLKIFRYFGAGLRDFCLLLAKAERTCEIHVCKVKGRNITIGPNSLIETGVSLDASDNSREAIWIGRGTKIRKGAFLNCWGGKIRIGEHVTVNSNVKIYGTGGVTIGSNTLIAADALFVASSHLYQNANAAIRAQGYSARGISVGQDVWIGAKATVLDGVTIGDGAVIGAGSLVKDDVIPYAVVVGVPARVISQRQKNA